MNSHYNAFISYRHHPDDIRVASEIHRSLERFHAPRSIRKKYGKIDRLFRDKEELPITSDLNDDIDDALRNSDYLIVICSVHLKESIWCQREIERFLQTHSRNRVLTVLASGEPYDVIPDILLHEDVVDPVTGQTRRIDIEPLSCDWRVKGRKAKQEELLRLAAPLLGCAYDELRQRQKQYKARRNTAIISSALVASFSLTAYFLHTSITIQKANVRIQAQNEEIHAQNEEIKAANIQIQENLDEALINQSRHLATAAQERLAEGDRLTAISLAMAALPSENNVRPYVPEAERVLSEALGVYSTAGQVEAVGTVTPGTNAMVRAFCVTESEKVMYLYDQRQIITAWDTQTLQKLGQIDVADTVDSMVTLNNDNLVVRKGLGGSAAACYQPDGTQLWQMDSYWDMAYLPQQDMLLSIRENDSGVYELLFIDSATGKAVREPIDLSVEDSSFHASDFVAEPNGGVALISYYKGLWEPMPNYAVDLNTGAKLPVDLAEYPVAPMITEDGRFICMGQEEGLGIAAVVEGNRVTTPGTRQIYCYDLHTGSLLWQNAVTAPVGAITSGIFTVPGSQNLLCVCGNIFMLLDGQTGETLSQCGAGSVIKDVLTGEQYATAILQDGYLCTYWYGNNYCYEIKCMADNVSSALVGENCYSHHWQEDHVTVYQNIAGASVWEIVLENGFSVSKQKTWGRYLAFQDSGYQYICDIETQSVLHITEKGQLELLGFSTDGKKVWYAKGSQTVTAMDIATGSWETVEITVDEGSGGEVKGSPVLHEDCLYYVVGNLPQPMVVTLDLNTGNQNVCTLQIDTQEDITYWSWEIRHVQGQHLWLWRYGKMLLEVDLNTGKTQYVAEETSQLPMVAVHPERKLAAVTAEGTILLKKLGEDSVTAIALDGVSPGSLYFREDNLLALCDNGFIYRFDLSGKLLGKTELWVGSGFGSNLFSSYTDFSKLSWQFTQDNKLVVNALGEGNVIDCENWAVTATISNFLLYDETGNSLVCKVGKAIAGYMLHDTQQLLALAEEDLDSFSLSQEQKAAYGID